MKDDIKYLKQLLRGGKTPIYVIQRSVSDSGMTRKLTLFIMKDKQPYYLTPTIARVLGWNIDKNGYLRVTGCGMDMHFHTVYTLSSILYGHKNEGGYKLKYMSL